MTGNFILKLGDFHCQTFNQWSLDRAADLKAEGDFGYNVFMVTLWGSHFERFVGRINMLVTFYFVKFSN